jgi:hypothetical protein
MKKGDAVDAVIMGKYPLPGLVEAVTQSAVGVVFVSPRGEWLARIPLGWFNQSKPGTWSVDLP